MFPLWWLLPTQLCAYGNLKSGVPRWVVCPAAAESLLAEVFYGPEWVVPRLGQTGWPASRIGQGSWVDRPGSGRAGLGQGGHSGAGLGQARSGLLGGAWPGLAGPGLSRLAGPVCAWRVG